VNRRQYKSGFTLVELITVMAVLPILLLLIHTALSSTTNARDMVEDDSAKTQIAHAIRNMILEDLSGCYIPPRPRQAAEDTKTSREFFEGRASGQNGHLSLNFITRRPSRTSGDKPSVDINEVGYRLVPNSKDYRYMVLVRREESLFDDKPAEGGTETTIYDRVISAEILYFDGTKWVKDWDFAEKNDAPVEVKVTLGIEVGKPGHTEDETVTVTVPIVTARNTVARSGQQ